MPLLAIVGNPPNPIPTEWERMRRVEEAQRLAQLHAWREAQEEAEEELTRRLAYMNPDDPRLRRLLAELEARDPYAAEPWGDEPPGWEPTPSPLVPAPAAVAAYEERLEAKRERLEERAARKRAEARAAFGGERGILGRIPMGQPILVGHHSERRHRRDLARAERLLRKGIEAEREAAQLQAAAERVGAPGVIRAEDPAAVVKLTEKLAQLERSRDHMKAVNKRLRAAAKKFKVKAKDVRDPELALQIMEAAGLEGRELRNMLQTFQLTPYHGLGYASYNLTNIGAEIRRTKKRIEELRREYARPEAPPQEFEGFEVVENHEIKRIQLVFDGKPGAKTRSLLKSNGFRWSRREGAWQRLLNEAGRRAARRVAEEITSEVHGGWTQNPDPAGTLVLNAYSSETRWYPLPPAEAAATALLEDLPGRPLPPVAEVAGYVRVGPWFARLADNPKRRGRPSPFWHQLLDTIRYSLYDLQLQQTSPGVASITATQWKALYPRIRVGKGKLTAAATEKAWKRFTKQIRDQDKKGAGIEAAKQPGWLHINVANAFDAAWRATGELHELGERRELELAPERAAEIAERYEWLEAAPPPIGEWVPEGFEAFGGVEAFEAAKHAARAGVALEVGSGRIAVSANPQELQRDPPRVTKHRLEDFEDHPGFQESLEKFRRFHDADPGEVVVYEIEDGSDKQNWQPVHWAMHEDLETRYMVPWDSNKQDSYWVHKHRSSGGVKRPLRVGHPFREDTTTSILRGSVIGEWWES